jgi:hypothetical protein
MYDFMMNQVFRSSVNGDYEKALKYYENAKENCQKALEISLKLFGKNHSDTKRFQEELMLLNK